MHQCGVYKCSQPPSWSSCKLYFREATKAKPRCSLWQWHLSSPKWLWITLRWPRRLLLSLNSSVPHVPSGKWIWVTLVFLVAHRKSVLLPRWALMFTHSSALLCTISSCQSPKRGQEGWPVWNLADKAHLTVHSICVRLWNCAEQLVYRSAADVEWWSVLYWLTKLCLCRVIYNLNIKSFQATVFRIFLFHFCYTFGYPGCGARDSWHTFIIRLLFSKSKRFEHLSAEKAAIKRCFSDCHTMLNFCPTMPMKQAADHDFSFSPPDCGTWISPPAQCPGLQPFSASHGHWDTIRSHQIVSFEHLGWEFSNLNRIIAALKTLQKLD